MKKRVAAVSDRIKLLRFQHLNGWQKLIGVLAVVMALLIVLNPEFLALGLVVDTAFFEMLVFALSLHLRQLVVRAFHICISLVSRGLRWLCTPTPGIRCWLDFATAVIAGVMVSLQRVFIGSRP